MSTPWLGPSGRLDPPRGLPGVSADTARPVHETRRAAKKFPAATRGQSEARQRAFGCTRRRRPGRLDHVFGRACVAREANLHRGQHISGAADHALAGNDRRATCSGRLDRSPVSRTAILWRNFSVSDRAAAKLRATSPTAANSGSPAISSRPDVATTALAKVAARPHLRSVVSRMVVPFP